MCEFCTVAGGMGSSMTQSKQEKCGVSGCAQLTLSILLQSMFAPSALKMSYLGWILC